MSVSPSPHAVPASLPLGILLSLVSVLPSAAQESAARFDAPLVVLGQNQASFRHLFDCNADGLFDALGYDREGSGGGFVVAVYRGDELGRFEPVWSERLVTARTTPPRAAVGSFGPDDPFDDFVVSAGRTVRVYRARTPLNPTFSELLALEAETDVLDVAAGDFDGDGFGDFALLQDGRLQVYRSKKNGELAEGPGWSFDAGRFDRVQAFSRNGTPSPVLLLSGPDDLEFRSLGSLIYFTPGPARGSRIRVAQTEGAIPHGCTDPMVAVGDADGDGDDDVVLFQMDGTYRLARQRPNGALQIGPMSIGGPATDLADVDGDGDLDGVCCGGGSSVFNRAPTNFEIALNEGAGTFEPSFRIPGLGAEHIAGVADLDGDGDAELVAGRVIYYSRGGVRPPVPTPFDDNRLAERALVDIDADGDLDFGVGLGPFLRNVGDGTCVDAQLDPPATAESPGFVGPGYPGDFDGDGLDDLLVERWDGGAFLGVHLLQNAGGSHLRDAGLVAVPDPPFSERTTLDPRSSLTADLDGDGRLDLLVRDELAENPSADAGLTWVWFNDLPAGFTEGPLIQQQVMNVGDLDGDQIQDIVVTQGWPTPLSGDHLWWRPGTGARDFGEPVRLLDTNTGNGYIDYARDNVPLSRFPGESSLKPVWVRDVDGIISAELMQSIYDPVAGAFVGSELRPTGYERIAAIFFTTEWEQRHMRPFTPDLDGNGSSDLLYGNLETAFNGVAYWTRGISGVYRFKTIQLFTPLAFADVDGDGDPDAIGERLIRSEFVSVEEGGARLQYGQATPGIGGYVPRLGASGPFRPGTPMTWHISGGPGGAQGVLVYGRTSMEAADTPVPGVTSYVDPAGSYYGTFPFQLDGTPGEPGVGTTRITLVPPAGHSGTTEYLQAWIDDTTTPGGMCATNALRIRWGD